MPRVYLDHNIVTRLAVERVGTPPGLEYEAIRSLLETGRVTFVLSAVSLYELARSTIEAHVANSIVLLSHLPLEWLSNPVYLQKQELKRHIAGQLRRPIPSAFRTMAQLWSAYGAENIVIGGTLADCIWTWHRDRGALREVERAAAETPDAIGVGRRALEEGLVDDNQPVTDAEFYRARIRARTDPHVRHLGRFHFLASYLGMRLPAVSALSDCQH
jgi:hypothetical protein